MRVFLGIDTSNYTTSAAAYAENGMMFSERMLLPVAQGERGLRQNDALFLHTKQLPQVVGALFSKLPQDAVISGVAASVRPRDAENSYMPCFLAGRTVGYSIACSHGVPFMEVSHQSGHLAAALYGANRFDLLNSRFLAFHVSGGTTEGLLVDPSASGFDVDVVSKTLDISAGQLIDRIGVRLGFGFPAGAELEKLALAYGGNVSAKPVIKDGNCCLSGVENICVRLLEEGAAREYAAAYCFEYVAEAIVRITRGLLDRYGSMPVLYAGGVMSSSYMRGYISERIDEAVFTASEYSSDNAAGTAYLAMALCAAGKE